MLSNGELFIEECLIPYAFDKTLSDRGTVYYEWETERGFCSLEVGISKFSFSYIPHDRKAKFEGFGGYLSDHEVIRRLIADYT